MAPKSTKTPIRRLNHEEEQQVKLAQEGARAEARSAGKTAKEVVAAGLAAVKAKLLELNTAAKVPAVSPGKATHAEDADGDVDMTSGHSAPAPPRLLARAKPQPTLQLDVEAGQAYAADDAYYVAIRQAVDNVLKHPRFKGIASEDALEISQDNAMSGVQDSS
jgi:hypothetical protein